MNTMNCVSVFGKLGAVFASLFILAGAYPAYASLYFEVDDAGTTADTANYISWDTATIIGTTQANNGADVYGFEWAGGFFQADTMGSDFDTMLALFNESGGLLLFNDDIGGGPFYSQISMELDPGNYFLGISNYANNYMGDMRYYWEEGIEGSYQIHKTVAMPLPPQPPGTAHVPEPTTMALLAIGFIGIMLSASEKGFICQVRDSIIATMEAGMTSRIAPRGRTRPGNQYGPGSRYFYASRRFRRTINPTRIRPASIKAYD